MSIANDGDADRIELGQGVVHRKADQGGNHRARFGSGHGESNGTARLSRKSGRWTLTEHRSLGQGTAVLIVDLHLETGGGEGGHG
mgnify:CR=1 FL=1